jgi:hypothetical protein
MSRVQTTIDVRCPECGFKIPAGVAACPICATQERQRPPIVLDWDRATAGQLIGTQQGDALRAPLVAQSEELPAITTAGHPGALAIPGTLTDARPQPEATEHPTQSVTTRQGAQVFGRVIAIDNSQREPPDFDLCRALTKALWVALLLASPLVLFGNTLVSFGPILAIAGVAGGMFLLRLLPWTNLLWFAYLAHANRRPDEQVPVWYARVRDAQDESEIMVRLKGLFSRGNLAPDDLVSFWGPWRGGVLMAMHGYNHRTQTAIEFHQSRWWIWLMLTLVLVAGVAFHLHSTWVSLNGMVR